MRILIIILCTLITIVGIAYFNAPKVNVVQVGGRISVPVVQSVAVVVQEQPEVLSLPQLKELMPIPPVYVKDLKIGESCFVYPMAIVIGEGGYGLVKLDETKVVDAETFPKITRVKNGFEVWFPHNFKRLHVGRMTWYDKDISVYPNRKNCLPILKYEIEKKPEE